MHGLDEEAEEDAAIAAAVRRKEKCEAAGLYVTDVFPPAPGSPMPMVHNETEEYAEQPSQVEESPR
jgi:hypothetical protein